MITEKLITDAWVFLRTHNNSIPDEVLDFIKDSSLAALRQQNFCKPDVVRCKELLQKKLREAEMLASWNVEGSENLDEHLRLSDAIKIVLKSIE